MSYKPLIIPGHPVILKNSKQVKMLGGRLRVTSSEAVLARKDAAIYHLRKQWYPLKTITGPVSLQIMSCGAWMSGDGNIPDASNLYQFAEDCLQAAGIINDDNQVEHHDGSRRVKLCDTCEKRRWMLKKKQWKKCTAVKRCPMECTKILIHDIGEVR